MTDEPRPPTDYFERFCDCLNRYYPPIARRAVEGRYGGVVVRFIGYDDLVLNKRAAGRPRDLADVAALEAARR